MPLVIVSLDRNTWNEILSRLSGHYHKLSPTTWQWLPQLPLWYQQLKEELLTLSDLWEGLTNATTCITADAPNLSEKNDSLDRVKRESILMSFPQIIPQLSINKRINDSTNKTMNDFETSDWIDDMLSEDCPEYDDLTTETLADTYSGEYEWKLFNCPHIRQWMSRSGRRVGNTFGHTITMVVLSMVHSNPPSKLLLTQRYIPEVSNSMGQLILSLFVSSAKRVY